jgi:hypothetical protein
VKMAEGAWNSPNHQDWMFILTPCPNPQHCCKKKCPACQMKEPTQQKTTKHANTPPFLNKHNRWVVDYSTVNRIVCLLTVDRGI